MRAGVVTMVRRTGGAKESVKVGNDFGHLIEDELEALQQQLWEKALEWRASRTFKVTKYDEMKERLRSGDREQIGFFLAPWKDDAANEDAIKDDCRATIRCFPTEFNTPAIVAGKQCFYSGESATHIALFARAF